ncbi:response regulator [Paraburkholderia tagetis]|uniref:Response regulator n=1 Tax=Paraburkholderia tagetis TaxID=2913261 RepID=A0A9X1UP80_9BURK|nr:response regulator [Paraburkholderia tagetis]MCG5079079.1 response regulator [Paraburkholderia tagetis]
MARCGIWTNRSVKFAGSIPAVLVVDDNSASGAALTAALGQEAIDARFVASGIEAMEWTRHWVPDLIVLDINMPRHDGFSTARVLRRLAPTRSAVIVAFTALGENEVQERGVLVGFDGYCQKGGTPDDLIRMIHAMTHT